MGLNEQIFLRSEEWDETDIQKKEKQNPLQYVCETAENTMAVEFKPFTLGPTF